MILAELSFVYVDNGHRTLRLGQEAYARMRGGLLDGVGIDAHADLFEQVTDRREAAQRFALAESWPPRVGEVTP